MCLGGILYRCHSEERCDEESAFVFVHGKSMNGFIVLADESRSFACTQDDTRDGVDCFPPSRDYQSVAETYRVFRTSFAASTSSFAFALASSRLIVIKPQSGASRRFSGSMYLSAVRSRSTTFATGGNGVSPGSTQPNITMRPLHAASTAGS